MMSDNISVVIPVKNEEARIMQCLEAVFSQSLKPHEVIVVDGHSTDRTMRMGLLIGMVNSKGNNVCNTELTNEDEKRFNY